MNKPTNEKRIVPIRSEKLKKNPYLRVFTIIACIVVTIGLYQIPVIAEVMEVTIETTKDPLSLITQYGEWDFMDYFFAGAIELLIFMLISLTFAGLYLGVKEVVRKVYKMMNEIVVYQDIHEAQIIEIWKEDEETTTLMPLGGGMLIPIHSSYTDYFVKISIGDSDSLYNTTIEIDHSLYEFIKSKRLNTMRVKIKSYIHKRRKSLIDYEIMIQED